MRSRYTAYALGEVDYVLETTHPEGPVWEADRAGWAGQVEAFCRGTTFEGLVVLAAEAPAGDVGHVTFRARLSQGGRDASFSERSEFRRLDGRWLYVGPAD